jgi:hypothetical protein
MITDRPHSQVAAALDPVARHAPTALVGLLVALSALTPVRAAAPMVKVQPGFYRMMLGDFEVTALNDGVVTYPTARVLPTATPQQIKKALAENSLTDPVGMSYNAFLINTGRKLVLIDTGTGGKLDDEPEFHGAGHLLANLRAAGYQPQRTNTDCDGRSRVAGRDAVCESVARKFV